MLLLDIAVADAYGAGFEFKDDEFIQKNNNLYYLPHALSSMHSGSYTDDTQMSIAIAEVVQAYRDECSNGRRAPITKLDIANAFVRCFKRDPRETYAKGFYKFLCGVETGQQFLDEIKPDSTRSGAAMRALPGGIFASVFDVVEFSMLQASVTHDTPEGRDSASAAALMFHYCYYALGPNKDLPYFLCRHISGYDWYSDWTGRVPCEGIACVQAAVTALKKAEEPNLLLQTCVEFGGDTDTVAAIAYGAGMQSRELGWMRSPRVFPENLYERLEGGVRHQQLLRELSYKFQIPERGTRIPSKWAGEKT